MANLDQIVKGTLQAARNYLLYSATEFREFLSDRYGVTSSCDLTAEQTDDLLAYLDLLGFGKKKRKWTCTLCMPRARETGAETKPVPVSQARLAVLHTLKNTVKWHQPNGFEAWLLRYLGITEVATGDDASRVIVALKGLIRSQKKRCHGCAWRFEEAGED